jgi:DNA-binding transcriptional LysR family regulator
MKTSIRFDLVDLRLFLFVTEAASITHGAALAGTALASASERIRLMEESLGAPLLERVRSTPAGAALAHHAQLIIQQLERMRGELSEYAEGLRGRVRLFANTTATAEFLPTALAAFLSQHPQIDIDLEERSSRDIVRAVAGNLADIGIVGDEVNPAKELQTFPFAEDRLVLIAPRDHVVSHQRRSRFAMPLPMTMLASLLECTPGSDGRPCGPRRPSLEIACPPARIRSRLPSGW